MCNDTDVYTSAGVWLETFSPNKQMVQNDFHDWGSSIQLLIDLDFWT
jgi:hypothetical protein